MLYNLYFDGHNVIIRVYYYAVVVVCSLVDVRRLCVFVRGQKYRRLEQDRGRILKRTFLGT